MSNKNVNPTFGLAEFRSAIELAVDGGRAAGLRHYQLAEILEQAAQAIRVRHAMATPIADSVSLDVDTIKRFLDRNSR